MSSSQGRNTMEAKLRERLLQILEERFDEPELRRIAFSILGGGSYDNLRGESKPEKALSLLEHVEFRGRADELIAYIKEFRPDIDLQGITTEKRPAEIEFMNRVSEVQLITNLYSPSYLLISAPLGYGKTRLLEIVKIQFQSQGWFCIHCILQKNSDYTPKDLICVILQELGTNIEEIDFERFVTPKEYGYLIAEWLVKRLNQLEIYGVLLLLDQVEALEEEVASQFLNEVIPGLNRGLRSAGYLDQLKVILSGCYVSHWEQLSKIPLGLMPVTPFNFPVVQQTVQRFMSNAKAALPIESIQEIAAHIMYLTGGHPGCMVKLLKGFPVGWPAHEYFIGQEDQHYTKIVEPVINDARQHIPENLEHIFDTLSVVRQFNSRFLRHLMDNRLIRWSKSEYELEDELTRTHMVTRTDGFLHDAITQRLFSIRLRNSEPDYFIAVCEEAIAFYEKSLQDSGINRPDILAVELLFQKLQYIHYKQQGGKEELLNAVPGVMEKLTRGRDSREMVRNCLELLKKDWEFLFSFNYLLRNGIYDNESPYDELLKSVAEFLSENGRQK